MWWLVCCVDMKNLRTTHSGLAGECVQERGEAEDTPPSTWSLVKSHSCVPSRSCSIYLTHHPCMPFTEAQHLEYTVLFHIHPAEIWTSVDLEPQFWMCEDDPDFRWWGAVQVAGFWGGATHWITSQVGITFLTFPSVKKDTNLQVKN